MRKSDTIGKAVERANRLLDMQEIMSAARDLYYSLLNGSYDGPEDVEFEKLESALKNAGYI